MIMPSGDRTGPSGQGPGTGRALGFAQDMIPQAIPREWEKGNDQ